MKGLKRTGVYCILMIGLMLAQASLLPHPAGAVNDTNDQTPTPSTTTSFLSIVHELQSMHELGIINGGNDQSFTSEKEAMQALPTSPAEVKPVLFHIDEAHSLGFSDEAILVAKQSVALSNDLLAEAAYAEQTDTSVHIDTLSIALEQYPDLFAFFETATHYSETTLSEDYDSTQTAALWDRAKEACGWYNNPLPAVDGPPHYFRNVSDPAHTLRSWGYHETPGLAGGGWTRPQTHDSQNCGWNTFRDHAYIYYGDGTDIIEQNYAGWTPRGEPNPEVWSSGPWPYPDWPTYVLWWHEYYTEY